jgi:hypothetical protein
MSDDVELQQDTQEETQRPRITLEKRLGRVLAGNGGNVSSQELQDLLSELETALNQTQADADRYHADCLDISCDDPVSAKANERASMLRHQRLEAVRPRLADLLKQTLRAEYGARWASYRARTAEKVKDSAKRFAGLEKLMAEVIDIFIEARETDKEVDRCNAAAPSSDAPRLQYTELTARNMERFTRDIPSLAEVVTLFEFKISSKQIWPPPRRSMGLLLTESMPPSPDPRYSDKWYESVGDRRVEQQAQQKRVTDYYSRQQQEREQREARDAEEPTRRPR